MKILFFLWVCPLVITFLLALYIAKNKEYNSLFHSDEFEETLGLSIVPFLNYFFCLYFVGISIKIFFNKIEENYNNKQVKNIHSLKNNIKFLKIEYNELANNVKFQSSRHKSLVKTKIF